MAAPKQTDPQFKLRLTPKIKEAIEKSAKENNRSMNAEILERLESSFDDLDGYKELSELFLETMRDNLATTQQTVEEMREASITVRLMRHTIDRLSMHLGENVPSDLKILLGVLTPNSTAIGDNPADLMDDLVDAVQRHEKILAERVSPEADGGLARRDKIKRLMESLQRRIDGDHDNGDD